jgi:transcriptional regulator with XRE-family HTH domain
MNELDLSEVLEEYAAATPLGNDPKILRQMSEQYPQFAEDLHDFAAARAVIRYAPEVEFSMEEESRYQKIGLQNLRSILNSSPQAAVESLLETAKAKNLNRSKFAAALGLSVSLVQYLEKRRLEFASIPPKIIASIAEVLEIAEETVAKYLNQPPVAAANASYKAQERPVEIKPKSFAEAVREDQQLSPEEKRKLLEL